MSDPVLVTVIIPARNEASAIVACLDAVAAQTYPHEMIEVVVVNGGSTDDTAEVAGRVLASGGFRRWAVLDNPAGTTPSNLNAGLAWAEGEMIVRVDARSIVPAPYVRACVEALGVPGRSVVGGSQIAVPRSSHWRDRAIARALNHRFAMGGSRYRRVGARSGPADTVYLGAFHTDQLRQAGGWNETFTTNQDFELNRRMAAVGSVWFEAGLPVSYLPRRTHREIAQQYHRFGRWKARYWRITNDRPRPRQLALASLPFGFLVLVGVVVVAIGPVAIAAGAPLALVGCLAIDRLGGVRRPESLPVGLVAGATNVLIGASWWTGVVRGLATPAPAAREAAAPARSIDGPAITYVVSRWGVPTQTFVRREALALRSAGVQVSALSIKRPDPVRELDAAWLSWIALLEGFAVAAWTHPRRTLALLASVRRATVGNMPAMLGATVVGIAWSGSGLVDRHLHSHFGWVAGAATRAAAVHAGQTYSVVYHAFDIHTEGLLDGFAAAIAADAQQVFVIAERDIPTVEQALGVRPTLARMGVPRAWTEDPAVMRPGGREIVAVGSLVEKKGHRHLIEAVASTPGWQLTIVGEGPQRGQLERLVNDLGLSSRVVFAGLLTEPEVRTILRRADVFALACIEAGNGDRDGIPVAMMEAMAAGLPVVTTDVGAIAELVAGAGQLVDQRNPAALVDALSELADDETRARVGAAGRARVLEAWTVEHLAGELVAALFGSSSSADDEPQVVVP